MKFFESPPCRLALLFVVLCFVCLAGKPVQAQTATVTVTPSSLAFGTPALSAQSAAVRPAQPIATPAASAPAAKPSMLLEALKEEIFQLEVEKKQGKITPEDYEKAKAALDQTLDRALKRQG